MKPLPRSSAQVLSQFGLIAVFLTACAAPAPTPTTQPSPRDRVAGRTGGTLRVGMDLAQYESFQLDLEEDPPRFDHAWDPATTWAREPFELFRCCLLRTLMSYNGRSTSEGGAELRPDLAAHAPEVSTDGLSWEFTLRDGLFYAPPFQTTPIVAGDFIRAIERAVRHDPFAEPDVDQTFGPYAVFLREVIAGADEFSVGTAATISGLQAENDKTLVIRLVRPAGDLGARLAMPVAAPIPAGAADGHDAGYGRYLVASGPYMIEGSEALQPNATAAQQPAVSGYVPGESLTLVRNPSWDWALDNLRDALPNRIELTQSNDYDAALAAVLDDQMDLHFTMDLDPVDISRFRADTAVASRVNVSPALASDWIVMNLGVPPFDDIHVRKAVQYVTNKRALVDLLDPSARIQTHAIPDAFQNDLLRDYDPYATADRNGSLAQAKAEMAQSRYDSDGDGICDLPVCEAIDVRIRDDFPEHWLAAESFATQLQGLGIQLNLQRVGFFEVFEYTSDPANRAPMAFTLGWGSDYLNASAWFGPLATGDAIGTDTGANLSLIGASPDQLASFGYSVTEVPSLNAPIRSCVELTGAAQFSCWAEVDQYLMERVAAWIPLDNRQTSKLTSTSVASFSFDASIALPGLEQIELVDKE